MICAQYSGAYVTWGQTACVSIHKPVAMYKQPL